MQPNARRVRANPRQARLVVIVAVALGAAALALVAFVWYPTTLQPNVTLTDASYATTLCAPVLGGYANRYDWTFTLANTGRADADVGVQFVVNGFSLGCQHYLVPQGSEVVEKAPVIWEVHSSPSACGPVDTVALSLASVARSPAIDVRSLITSTVGPVATMGFSGLLLGALSIVARRRGISLFADLGAAGWGVAFVTIFVATLFSGMLTQVLITPYNYPVDWTMTLIGVVAYGAVGVAVFVVACRIALREGARRRLPPG